MLKTLLVGVALAAAMTPLFAQGTTQRNCLHRSIEAAADRARRQQAIDYAVKVNMAESAATIGPAARQPKYRPLDELVSLPPVPPGFSVQFHNDDRSYAFPLKDTRDPCRYAIFSDQDKLVYEAVPRAETTGLVPLGTR